MYLPKFKVWTDLWKFQSLKYFYQLIRETSLLMEPVED